MEQRHWSVELVLYHVCCWQFTTVLWQFDVAIRLLKLTDWSSNTSNMVLYLLSGVKNVLPRFGYDIPLPSMNLIDIV